MLLDDFASPDLVSRLSTPWRAVSDQVMGGVSKPSLARARVEGMDCLHLSGDVRLDNNGGFIQAALDLAPGGSALDASGFEGVRLVVRGNAERYGLHLRTTDCTRPWQSYRADFVATPAWQSLDLAFSTFSPYRLELPMNVSRLRRMGLVAIGRAFRADLCVARVAFYTSTTP